MTHWLDIPLTSEEIERVRLRAAAEGYTSASAHVRAALTPEALTRAAERVPAQGRSQPPTMERVRLEFGADVWWDLSRAAIAVRRRLPDLAAAVLCAPGAVAAPPAEDDLPRTSGLAVLSAGAARATREVGRQLDTSELAGLDLAKIAEMARAEADLEDTDGAADDMDWLAAADGGGFDPGERYAGPVAVAFAEDRDSLADALQSIMPPAEHQAAGMMSSVRSTHACREVDGIAAVARVNADGSASIEARVGVRALAESLPCPIPDASAWVFPGIDCDLSLDRTARRLADAVSGLRRGMKIARAGDKHGNGTCGG